MNAERSDFESALRHWFDDGPTTMPDRVVGVVAARISRQPQQRLWRLRGRPFMNTYFKVAAGLAAALVLAFAAWQLLPGRGPSFGGQPTPTPAPSLAAPASPMPTWPWWVSPEDVGRNCGDGPNDGGLPRGCLRDLSAGTHQSVGLVPPLQFTVPAGWINIGAYAGWFVLLADTPTTRAGGDQAITVIPDMPLQELSCEDDPTPEPATAAELVASIETAEGVDVTAPAPISVGALSGQSVDVQLSAGWTATCPEEPSRPVAVVPGWRVHEGERVRLIVLDAGGGDNILIMLVASDQAAFALLATEGMSIVESFRFDAGPAAS